MMTRVRYSKGKEKVINPAETPRLNEEICFGQTFLRVDRVIRDFTNISNESIIIYATEIVKDPLDL